MSLILDRTMALEHNPINCIRSAACQKESVAKSHTQRSGTVLLDFTWYFLIQTYVAKVTESGMTASSRELGRVILEAVSEDYQSFESVVKKLSQASQFAYGAMDIESMLLSSIADNLVAAYLIHADPPYATEVGVDADTIKRYWFCITEQGRQYLRRLPRKRAVSRRPAIG